MGACLVLVGMKKQGPRVPDSVKAVCYAEPVHPSLSPRSTTSSVDTKNRGNAHVQHGGVHCGVVIPAKVFVVQKTQADRKETNASRN